MSYEIERKFLVDGDFKSKSFKEYPIKQGYLAISDSNVVRIRVRGDEGFITIKSATFEGSITRNEWEYKIPVAEADEMLLLCKDSVIEKKRYNVQVGDHVFEVDEFYGDNEGLLLAEVELNSEDELFERPEWLGEEVTGDIRYYNSYLSEKPFSKW